MTADLAAVECSAQVPKTVNPATGWLGSRYRNQGEENSGYVTDEFLREIAEDAKVPDLEQWEADRDPARWSVVLDEVDSQASDLSFTGTPSFALEGPGGTMPLTNASTAADIQGALSGGG